MAQGGLDLLRVHIIEQANGSVLLFDDHVEVGGPRIDAATRRQFRDGEPFLCAIVRTPQEPDSIEATVDQQPDVSRAGCAVRADFFSDLLSLHGILEEVHEFLGPQLLRPLRERVAQRGSEVRVHVVVDQDVQPAIVRGLPQRLDLRRLAEASVLRVVVADLDGASGVLPDLYALLHRIDDRLPLPADVGRVESTVASDDLCEFDDFLGRGETAGRIDEAGAHAERTGSHGLLDVCLHRPQLLAVWRPLVESHDRGPDGPVADEARDVDADPVGLHEIEILSVRRPIPLARLRIIFESSRGEFAVPLADRRGRIPAIPDYMGRHALADRALGRRLDEDAEVAVRVDVDEARRHEEALRIDGPVSGSSRQLADSGDSPSLNPNVRGPRGRTGAVEDVPSPDEDAEGHRGGNVRLPIIRFPPRGRAACEKSTLFKVNTNIRSKRIWTATSSRPT